MLIKLMKFEMKAMGRILLPLYAILLVGSGLIAVWLKSGLADNPLVSLMLRRLSAIFVVLFVLFAIATALIIALLVVQRFYKNLLGTEGYLMFTLPVTTAENIISKGLTSLIWIVIGGIVGGLGGVMVIIGSGSATFSEFVSDLQDLGSIVFKYTGNGNIAIGAVLFAVLLLLGVLKSLAQVYAAAAVGQLWNDHKVIGGVLVYIGFSVLETLLMQIPGVESLNSTIEQMIDGTGMSSMIWVCVIAALGLAVYYTIAWALLDKKLNLE